MLRHIVLLSLFCIQLGNSYSPDVLACDDDNVRDNAFKYGRDQHVLCVMAASDDPQGQAIYQELESRLAKHKQYLNIDLALAHVDDPSVNWKARYGIPSAPPSSPVVVLAGYHKAEDRSFYIKHWEPKPEMEELDALLQSPTRKLLPFSLAKNYAALIYVPAAEPNEKIQSTLQEAVETWNTSYPMPVDLFQVDRNDASEAVLLSFLGVRPGQGDWAGIVFGRGKAMQPPLDTEELTVESVHTQLAVLETACTCLRTAADYGVDIPMLWPPEADEQLITLFSVAGDEDLLDTSPASVSGEVVLQSTPFAAIFYTFGALVLLVLTAAAVVFVRSKTRG